MATDAKTESFIPVLYQYFHCPFCVRAEFILRLKKIPHKLVFLEHHDEKAHLDKVGVKAVPILEYAPGKFMKESMDIVLYLDKTYPPALLQSIPAGEEHQRITEAIGGFYVSPNLLCPRVIALRPVLPEFRSQEARDYFTKKKEGQLMKTFEQASAKSGDYIKSLEKDLETISPLVKSVKGVHGDFLTTDDVSLFAQLWELTMFSKEEVRVPQSLRDYQQHWIQASGKPTYVNREGAKPTQAQL